MTAFDIYFTIFSCISVLCATGLLCARHPITGAVNMIGIMLSLAGIYSLLNAPFLGVIQILVYTGAIMMLIVFVIMVLNSARDEKTPRMGTLGVVSLILPILFVVCMGMLLKDVTLAVHATPVHGSVEVLAQQLFDLDNTGYYILFEVIGLVLLTAIVGAVMLAKRDLSTPASNIPRTGSNIPPTEKGAH